MTATHGRGRYAAARALVALFVVSAGTVALPRAPGAHAELVACRSDPVVILSDGSVVDLGANIADSVEDVQKVAYTLHVPSGDRIVLAVNTTGLLGLKETFDAVADQPDNEYSSSTRVTTGVTGVAVTATAAIVPLLDQPATGTASGQAPQNLVIRLTT